MGRPWPHKSPALQEGSSFRGSALIGETLASTGTMPGISGMWSWDGQDSCVPERQELSRGGHNWTALWQLPLTIPPHTDGSIQQSISTLPIYLHKRNCHPVNCRSIQKFEASVSGVNLLLGLRLQEIKPTKLILGVCLIESSFNWILEGNESVISSTLNGLTATILQYPWQNVHPTKCPFEMSQAQ